MICVLYEAKTLSILFAPFILVIWRERNRKIFKCVANTPFISVLNLIKFQTGISSKLSIPFALILHIQIWGSTDWTCGARRGY